jgi:hypothetical protein
MMRPLRELSDSSDPIEAKAAALAGAVTLVEPSEAVERRLRRNLVDPPPRARRSFQLRPAFALVLGLGLTALAGAAHRLWNRPQPLPPPTSTRKPVTRPAPRTTPARVGPAPVAVPKPAELRPEPNALSRERIRRPSAPVAQPIAAPPEAEVPPPASAIAPPPPLREAGAELVLAAARSLRRDHDPQRALAQLAEYRRRFPGGDLTAESFALEREAHQMLGR